MSGKKGNARIKIATGALLVCVLAGAATAGAVVGFGSAPPPDAPAASTPTDTSAGPSTAGRIPGIGDVVIEHGRYGNVIVDRATHGKQFALAGIQAGECLRYIKANPNPSAADVRAACPGQHGR